MDRSKKPYCIKEPTGDLVPIVVSVPHCGSAFPEEVTSDYIEDKRLAPDDTDWFVHDLYDFVSDMGITMIHAPYSRWVIDLNRDPDSKPLYNDGRIITGLTTLTDFMGDEIYHKGQEPDKEEIDRRLDQYYWPYYKKVQELLDERKERFGKVLLWDAHSIRRHVPTIQEEFFPDMILGNNLGKTAHADLIQVALERLEGSSFDVSHNHPFKGGHITRYFGRPEENQHALQLEMNKILYMDDAELQYDTPRAEKVQEVLKSLFLSLIDTLKNI